MTMNYFWRCNRCNCGHRPKRIPNECLKCGNQEFSKMEGRVMNCIVFYCKEFEDLSYMKEKLTKILGEVRNLNILTRRAHSGESNLIDDWLWKGKLKVTTINFHPDMKWKKDIEERLHAEMIELADAAVIFHDGKDWSSSDLIKRSKKAKLKLRVILV